MLNAKIICSLLFVACFVGLAASAPKATGSAGDDPWTPCEFCESLCQAVREHAPEDVFEGFLVNRCEDYHIDNKTKADACTKYVEAHHAEMYNEDPKKLCEFFEICK